MPENDEVSFHKLIQNMKAEFEAIEEFVEFDAKKSERFKTYLKRFYDYLKINEEELCSDVQNGNKLKKTASINSVPELIVDKDYVDTEQIYQQIQLYNNEAESSCSLNSLTKFFSKCLVDTDSIAFNVDLAKKRSSGLSSDTANGTTTDNIDDSNDGEDEQEFEDDDDDDEVDEDDIDDNDDDDALSELSNDSVGNMLKNSKVKLELNRKEADLKSKKAPKKLDENYGIPDGSDSEISDFEVDEKNADNEEDDEEEEEEEDDDEEEEDEDIDEETEKNKINLDDIDSDEVDEELVDLYTDLGDEKEVMGIGKAAKSFDQIDFDREDFGLNNDDDDAQYFNEKIEQEETDAPAVTKSKKPISNDLFNVNLDEDDEEAKKEDPLAGKSSFEIRQLKLKEQIDDIHKGMLNDVTDKQWQLKGEVTAKTRPKESLLEEYLEFDHTTRQAPISSVATTEELEAMIKRRIKDKSFDDVERKVKPVEMLYEYKKQTVLDQEKSKIGLGEVYEKEYLKQQEMAENGEAKSKDVVNPKHDEIKSLMQKLFVKLDALSNFHYTPKAPTPEIKVVSNMPSIVMEEVAPVIVADTNTLAPEEIRKNINKLPKSKSEEDKKDKKKNLRAKKLKGKKIKEEKEKRLKVAQAIDPENTKISKEIAMNKLKKQAKNMSKNIKILKTDKKTKVNSAYRSSSAFFEQLQETNQTGSKLAAQKKRLSDSKDKNKLTSKKLKL